MKKIEKNGIRFYKRDEDQYYPSVTSVVGKTIPKGIGFQIYLANSDSWKAVKEYRNKRRDIGTKVHEICERIINGNDFQPTISTEVTRCGKNFQELMHSENLEPLFTETQVFSDKFKFAGTVDLIARHNGTTKILDIKTSKRIYEGHEFQIMMYFYALKEMQFPIKEAGFIKISKKKAKIIPFSLPDNLEERIKSVMLQWDYLNQVEPK